MADYDFRRMVRKFPNLRRTCPATQSVTISLNPRVTKPEGSTMLDDHQDLSPPPTIFVSPSDQKTASDSATTASNPPKIACGHCRYFSRVTESGGECRRYAPRASHPGEPIFIPMDIRQWCGEFAQKQREHIPQAPSAYEASLGRRKA